MPELTKDLIFSNLLMEKEFLLFSMLIQASKMAK